MQYLQIYTLTHKAESTITCLHQLQIPLHQMHIVLHRHD